jgi:hypothetical protein
LSSRCARAGRFSSVWSGATHWKYFCRDGQFVAEEFDLPHCEERLISEAQLRSTIASQPREWRNATARV